MRVCPLCHTTTEDRTCPKDKVPTLEQAAFEDALVGQTFADKYEIRARLGAGNMGTVYFAHQGAMDRDVALKVLPQDKRTPDAIQRFYREIRVSAKLNHPNCIQVHDFGHTDDGHLYLAMELIRGETLGALIKREGRLEPLRAARIGAQIAKGLGAAHALGIVHRDLKPENVMLTTIFGEPDFVKILDFGIARAVESGVGDSISTYGLFVGTPLYASPEQCRGERAGPASDLYALGVLLYRLMVGQAPFMGQNPLQVLELHKHEPAPRLARALGGQVPPELDAIVAGLLAKDLATRLGPAEEVLKRLDAVVASRWRPTAPELAAEPESDEGWGPDSVADEDRPPTILAAPPPTIAVDLPGPVAADPPPSSARRPPTGNIPIAGAPILEAVRAASVPPPTPNMVQRAPTQESLRATVSVTTAQHAARQTVSGSVPGKASHLGTILGVVVALGGAAAVAWKLTDRPADPKPAPVVAVSPAKPPPEPARAVPMSDVTCGITPCPLVAGATVACNAAKACEYTSTDVAARPGDGWVYLPPGPLLMGAPNDEPDVGLQDGRVHAVTIARGVLFQKTEVTVAQHEACEAAGRCKAPSVADFDVGWGQNGSGNQRTSHPQNGLTWEHARDMCAFLGGRLPSEAEWEYAASGSTHRPFPWGPWFATEDAEQAPANLADASAKKRFKREAQDVVIADYHDGADGTAPVGSYPRGASPFGVLDLAGNVAEWVADCMHKTNEGAPTDGSAWTEACSTPDRITRGGHFFTPAKFARTASRVPQKPTVRSAGLGARCARPL